MLAKHIKHYPLSHTIALTITILSLIPFGHIQLIQNVPLADKWTHILMYATLATTIALEYLRQHKQPHCRQLITNAIIAPILMSAALELLQEYATNYRSGEWLDLLANTIGVLIGTSIGLVIMFFHIPPQEK